MLILLSYLFLFLGCIWILRSCSWFSWWILLTSLYCSMNSLEVVKFYAQSSYLTYFSTAKLFEYSTQSIFNFCLVSSSTNLDISKSTNHRHWRSMDVHVFLVGNLDSSDVAFSQYLSSQCALIRWASSLNCSLCLTEQILQRTYCNFHF